MIINFSNLGGGGGSYVLPVATDSRLGGVKIGSGITVDSAGTISAQEYTLPTASSETLGGIKVGSGLTITDGVLSANGGGGDSTALEEITELPESPEDGAVYNYNGLLIKYVDGPGQWGKWFGDANVNTNRWDSLETPVWNSVTLNYAVIPESVNGELIAEFSYFSNAYLYFYIDTVNKVLNAYTSSDTSVTPTYVIQKDGSNVQCTVSYGTIYVQWKGNLIRFNINRSVTNYRYFNTLSANTSHYELVGEPITLTENTKCYNNDNIYSASDSYFLPKRIGPDNKIIEVGAKLTKRNIMVNGTYCKDIPEFGDDSSSSIPNFYAPTSSGVTGTLLVSQGNAAPQWKTTEQALGVSFWTGTQDEYDAITTKSPTTLYIIVPDE